MGGLRRTYMLNHRSDLIINIVHSEIRYFSIISRHHDQTFFVVREAPEVQLRYEMVARQKLAQ